MRKYKDEFDLINSGALCPGKSPYLSITIYPVKPTGDFFIDKETMEYDPVKFLKRFVRLYEEEFSGKKPNLQDMNCYMPGFGFVEVNTSCSLVRAP